MSSLSFLTNPRISLIADASVVINLNATGRASEIINAFPNPVLVVDSACAELEIGAQNGHADYRQLVELIRIGMVKRVSLGTSGGQVYESLIDGSALRTLDDGEAATIAYADENGCVALIDERKARTLCNTSFPQLVIVSTVELLMHEAIAASLGAQGQVDALMNALTSARMRVPAEFVAHLSAIIGVERTASCLSLPKYIREGTLAR